MSAIPSSFLPPRALWPERIYTLPEHATYPAGLNSTEELVDRQVEAGHGDRAAILYEDQRITYRQLLGSVSRLGSALRGLGLEEEARVPGRLARPALHVGGDVRYKLPREVEFVPQLPRAPGPAGPGTGKLLRRVLREQAGRG